MKIDLTAFCPIELIQEINNVLLKDTQWLVKLVEAVYALMYT